MCCLCVAVFKLFYSNKLAFFSPPENFHLKRVRSPRSLCGPRSGANLKCPFSVRSPDTKLSDKSNPSRFLSLSLSLSPPKLPRERYKAPQVHRV